MKRVPKNKIPELILSVKKSVSEKRKIEDFDAYMNVLIDLNEVECYYLKYNKSNDLYDNDLHFCCEVLTEALGHYERDELYERCHLILTSKTYYLTFLKK